MVLEAPGFLKALEKIFGLLKDRDPCDAESWDFSSGRASVSSIFGTPADFVNMFAGAPHDVDGSY